MRSRKVAFIALSEGEKDSLYQWHHPCFIHHTTADGGQIAAFTPVAFCNAGTTCTSINNKCNLLVSERVMSEK